MSTALARFLQRQLDARGMTADLFAKKHGLNSSGLYQLLRGERTYVQDRTMERLAAALGMTLAEMVTAMATDGSPADPDEAEWVALMRQVPAEKLPAAKDMLRGLAIQPTSQRTASGRRDAAAQRQREPLRQLRQTRGQQDEPGANSSLPKRSHAGNTLWRYANEAVDWVLQVASPRAALEPAG